MNNFCTKCGAKVGPASEFTPALEPEPAPIPQAAPAVPDPTPFYLAWRTRPFAFVRSISQEFTINDAVLTYSENGNRLATVHLDHVRRVTLSTNASLFAWFLVLLAACFYIPVSFFATGGFSSPTRVTFFFILYTIPLGMIYLLRYALYSHCLSIEVMLDGEVKSFSIIATKRKPLDQIVQALFQRVALPPVSKRSDLKKVILLIAVTLFLLMYYMFSDKETPEAAACLFALTAL